jgi:molecular chaperone GrpE
MPGAGRWALPGWLVRGQAERGGRADTMTENREWQREGSPHTAGAGWQAPPPAHETATPDAAAAGDTAQAAAPAGASATERELAEARIEAQANWDKFLRARADMDNYRRRSERALSEAQRSAKRDLLARLLSVVDNLERATQYEHAAAAPGDGDANPVVTGLRMVLWQLRQVLSDEGVKEMEAAGEQFSPYLHEAVGTVTTQDHAEHSIIDVVEEGYLYHDEVLRPAKVRVATSRQEG